MARLSNKRHEAFAQALAKGMSATEAYEKAGYKPNQPNAARLISNDMVRARVDEIQSKGAERAEIDIARTLAELGRLGFSDIRAAFAEDGSLKAPKDWDDDFAQSVAAIEVVSRRLPGQADERQEDQAHGGSLKRASTSVEYVHKIKLWDKNSALDKIAKHLGMFIERHEHTGKDGGPIVLWGGKKSE